MIDIKQQKKFRSVFKELEESLKILQKKQMQLGWQQRNELISHVYSNYDNDEKLLSKREEWEKAGEKYRATEWVFKLLQKNMNIYGYFENTDKMIKSLDNIITACEQKEYYELAATLNFWRRNLIEF